MQKFTITPINIKEDLFQIDEWRTLYKDSLGMRNINEFILDNSKVYGLKNVIITNFDTYTIGSNEKIFSLVAKTHDGEIIAWILTSVYDMLAKDPQLEIEYIVINPKFQNQGYGTEILKEIIFNGKSYFEISPTSFSSVIRKDNEASIALFKKFNFDFSEETYGFYLPTTNNPNFLPDENQNSLGE